MATVCQKCVIHVVISVVGILVLHKFFKFFSLPLRRTWQGLYCSHSFWLRTNRINSSAPLFAFNARLLLNFFSLNLSQNSHLSKNPNFSTHSITTLMAKTCDGSSTSKHRSSFLVSCQAFKRFCMSSPPASLAETMPATSPPAPVGGMGFNFLPSLPIISKIFGFLTSLHLRSVGLELSDVPPEYG